MKPVYKWDMVHSMNISGMIQKDIDEVKKLHCSGISKKLEDLCDIVAKLANHVQESRTQIEENNKDIEEISERIKEINNELKG